MKRSKKSTHNLCEKEEHPFGNLSQREQATKYQN